MFTEPRGPAGTEPGTRGGNDAPRMTWVASMLLGIDRVENFLTWWIPPWRRGLPGVLKIYLFFGIGWGVKALIAATLDRPLDTGVDDLLVHAGGQLVLALGGAVAVAQALLILWPRPVGPDRSVEYRWRPPGPRGCERS